MSSTAANSAARKRRANKQGEPIKPNMKKQTDLQYNNFPNSNEYYDMETTMKPLLNSKDAIYFMNNRLLVVETVLKNIAKGKINDGEQLHELLDKIKNLEKKIDDTIISSNVKNNMLEVDIISVKDKLTEIIDNNKNYSKIFNKMQSLVIYDDNDDDNQNHEDIVLDNEEINNKI